MEDIKKGTVGTQIIEALLKNEKTDVKNTIACCALDLLKMERNYQKNNLKGMSEELDAWFAENTCSDNAESRLLQRCINLMFDFLGEYNLESKFEEYQSNLLKNEDHE